MPEIADEFPSIALVGFGEAGHAFASGWSLPPAVRPKAYDLKLHDAATAGRVLDRCASAGAEPVADATKAIEGAGLIFSVVTADQALEVARACAPHLAHGALWLDCNSCAPQTKQQAAALIEAAGGRYVDVAAPVYPKRHEVPLLLAGPHAAQAAVLIKRLGMRPSVSGPKVGDASSIKMLRSVMIKGLEALTTECLLAARRAGVEDAVLASLQASDPGIDWRARGSYNLERMMVHGARRAAEVEEVCITLRAFGLPDWMSRGTIEWQRLVSSLDVAPGEDDLARRSDAILSKL
jgi:3-hydroxyisobutyrate dehydrogenase-like beta-hydroxyacid dehydrogenase